MVIIGQQIRIWKKWVSDGEKKLSFMLKEVSRLERKINAEELGYSI